MRHLDFRLSGLSARLRHQGERHRRHGGVTSLRFGIFELDLEIEELRKRGRPVPLQPQPLKLLALLAGRPGELVTREEIQTLLWDESTFVDREQGTAYCVREVRRALGDSARNSRFVETVPGRGFRFLAEPRRGPRRRGATLRRLRKGRWLAAAALVMAVFAALAGLTALWPEKDEIPRLALLPFESLSAGEDGEMQAWGLTEELIGALGRRLGDRVAVLGPHSVYQQREGAWSLDEAARLLDADYLVTGTVRSSESGVRITVRLLQAPGLRTLWSQEYDAIEEDPVALQIRLGFEIGQALGLELLPDLPVQTSAQTQRALSMARNLERALTPEALGRARDVLEAAVAKEPLSAPLHLELARVYRYLGYELRGLGELESAVRMDPTSAPAHLSLGIARLYWSLDTQGAEPLFEQALALNPSLATAHQFQAFLYSALGRHQDALAAIARARSLDPLYEGFLTDSGWIHYFARLYEEAEGFCDESLTLTKGSPSAHHCRVLARLALGDLAGAREAARLEMRRVGFGEPDDPEWISAPSDQALERYWRWRITWTQSRPLDPGAPMELADSYMALGEADEALASMERAFETKRGWERLHLAQYPLYDPLRHDPRFQHLLGRLVKDPHRSPAAADG